MRQSSNAETRFSGTISSPSLKKFLPRSLSSKQKPTSNPNIRNSDAENTPPTDPNILINHEQSLLPSTTKQSHSKTSISQNHLKQSKSPLESDPSVKVRANFFFSFWLIFFNIEFVICEPEDGYVQKFLLFFRLL